MTARRTARARVGAVGSVTALVVGPLLVAASCSSPHPPHVVLPAVTLRISPADSPLQAPGHDGVSIPADVGVPASFGTLVLTNVTSRPITIVSVEPGPHDGALAWLGARASSSQTRHVYSLGAAQGAFPYPSGGADWRVVPGVVVPPVHDGGARGVEVLVGLAARRSGRWSMHDVTVTYRSGAQTYVTTYGDTYTVCAPKTHIDCAPLPPT